LYTFNASAGIHNREVTKQRASSLLIGPNAFGHAGWGSSMLPTGR
jgi:hypothetical protein